MRKEPEASQSHRIDVHHHILPAEYVTALEHIGIANATGARMPEWTLQQSLDVMDEHGIAAAITSISTPGVYFKDRTFSRDLARRCNEYAARLVGDHLDRFGAFASLPLPDVEGALRELEYAVDTLRLDGVILLSNVAGHYLGERDYEKLFAELNRRKAVVFIHPNDPPGGSIINAFVEYPLDTTRAVANLMYTGMLERYSRIRFILAHAGGPVPYLATRIAGGQFTQTNILKLIYYTLKRLRLYGRMYYDTTALADPYALRSLQELVKPSRILFGSNYVWSASNTISAYINGLQAYDGFDAQALAAIERKSALELFPRFRKR